VDALIRVDDINDLMVANDILIDELNSFFGCGG